MIYILAPYLGYPFLPNNLKIYPFYASLAKYKSKICS